MRLKTIAAVLAVGLFSFAPLAAEDVTPAAEVTGDHVIGTAMKYLGTRYRRGSASPKGFDCSGFTSFVYGKQHISLLRSSRQQWTQGQPIQHISNLKKGDLVFFGGSRAVRSVGHVGIVSEVADDGRSFSFVHAARTGVKVDKSTAPYYNRRYLGARRILEN